jgi:hypothetical protein
VIRSFGLPREVLIELFLQIHDATLSDYEICKHRRMKDERFYQYRITTSEDAGEIHLFVVAVDDSTSPDHLYIVNIGHGIL